MVLFLIMLPFAFIRFFYAPWIEAQIHVQSPRAVPPDTAGHVIICRYDSIAPNLINRLRHHNIPYFVIEPDSAAAVALYNDDISVIQGDLDSRQTFEAMEVARARLVFANAADTTNTNITLTVREIAPQVPIIAIASSEDAIDILELSGATQVLPLKHRLGEYLANRINVGDDRTHVIRKLGEWLVVEFTVHNTTFANRKLCETRIRELTGANIVGIWENGHLVHAAPDRTLTEFCVPVAVGTQEQIDKLDELLHSDQTQEIAKAVLIIGGGTVGCAAAKALRRNGVKVYIVDCKKELRESLSKVADRVTIGDAADLDTIMDGGLSEVSLVILSTNDDAINIYLSVYCRRLDKDVRIVSRITHERNVEAIHRAGSDFILSYAPLGAESVIAFMEGREPVIMGEGVELYTITVPESLAGKMLGESGIGSVTGLVVLAVQIGDEMIADPSPATTLLANSRISVLGTPEQMELFAESFG
jgi:Trk K+ transport system NAD-binding subunit